jgi:beta-1,4-mannosyltransferase
VWTAHNIRSRETRNPRLQTLFWKLFPKLLQGWISLSEAGRQQTEARIPHLRQVPSFVIPHGHYRGEYPAIVTRDEARARLCVAQNSRVMLSFGRIRGYKNLPLLVNSFMKMSGADVVLFLAGFPECSQTAESLERVATMEPRLRLELRFIKKNEVQLFFKPADLIVLPYREILNSGVALLALSFNGPVLVPAIGALPELQALVGDEWVRCYSGELTPEKLDAALNWAVYAKRSTAPCMEDLNWAKLARETLLAHELVASNQWGTGRRKSGGICTRVLRTRH